MHLRHSDHDHGPKEVPVKFILDDPESLTGTDRNIDHRRVPNLMRFFERQDKVLAVTRRAEDYQPGDIVVWRLGNGRLHMGIVSDCTVGGTRRPMVIHNIGRGAERSDDLFGFEVIGHYRWSP